jgi:hypothetical protein
MNQNIGSNPARADVYTDLEIERLCSAIVRMLARRKANAEAAEAKKFARKRKREAA